MSFFIDFFVQTVFIIALVNNQLLELVEKRLIWVLGHIPGMDNVLPKMMTKLHSVKEKYLSAPVHSSVSPTQNVCITWNVFLNSMLFF